MGLVAGRVATGQKPMNVAAEDRDEGCQVGRVHGHLATFPSRDSYKTSAHGASQSFLTETRFEPDQSKAKSNV